MILLILNTVGKEKEVTTVFKFQYDSINTAKTLHSLVPDICFKFQYDSINTSSCTSLRWPSVIFKFQYDSINTLIRFIALCAFADFKFQYDSINTLSALSFLQVLSALNSNMILLIHSFFLITSSNSVFFKFQYDSINTMEFMYLKHLKNNFKFQYDSINTTFHFMVQLDRDIPLNSNMILLIRSRWNRLGGSFSL